MLFADNINCSHGFTTRWGGVSQTPFNELNLGGPDDKTEYILENRKRVFEQLKLDFNKLCNLKQVHGAEVCIAKPGTQEGDALVTNEPNHVLAISIADCYPILFHDPLNKVIGAAHAGWRGTVNRIAENTIDKMCSLGADTRNIKVAIGQGISPKKFEVGTEVISEFREKQFSDTIFEGNYINLIRANIQVLEESGITPKNIWTMNRCTFEDDFFSYRRDKGLTGRMWALITL
ncbi:MAG: peptidoglycan editing factor PgeF [Bacteroidota bacterium]|nr:peptidoglycan editing factor PgeF [Bacteroidota bacterium]MCA6441870.1 peptidoglycan editing factor PgeF [Bacteroidota bacterium]